MLPTIAIVGRPNVGKSTLFNVLTRSRAALVADQAGLTRDRIVGRAIINERPFFVIDTGGLDDEADAMVEQIAKQALQAISEAQFVLFMVDGRDGLTAADENIAMKLRQFNKPIHIVVNKAEHLNPTTVSAEFYRLGFQALHVISASHRFGIAALLDSIDESVPDDTLDEEESEALEEADEFFDEDSEDGLTVQKTFEEQDNRISIAFVGRPNVGKSTLVNRILGYERVIAFDQPGTTRDSVYIPFERNGVDYTLIDTAGIRRKARVDNMIEKFSILKTLQAIDDADVVIMLMDAREGMTDQDANLLGEILESGAGLVIAINKWDHLPPYEREQVRHSLSRKLHFIDFAKIHFISALYGSGVGDLFKSIKKAYDSANIQVATSRLNQILEHAVVAFPPPLVRGRRIKPRFIHQGGVQPPTFVVHGNQVESTPDSYKRYLINTLRKEFNLQGTPIEIEFKQGDNPFAGKRNMLTPRQIRKRKRLMKHVKGFS